MFSSSFAVETNLGYTKSCLKKKFLDLSQETLNLSVWSKMEEPGSQVQTSIAGITIW